MLGPLCEQHIKTFLIVRKRDAAHMMQPARHARDFLKLLIKLDRIALQSGHIGVAIKRMKATRCVPRRARGKFSAFYQHHIGPAEFGEVKKNAASNNAAADNGYSSGGFHQWTFRFWC